MLCAEQDGDAVVVTAPRDPLKDAERKVPDVAGLEIARPAVMRLDVLSP